MPDLNAYPHGSVVRIVAVRGSDEVGCRMLEMGVTPGVEVRIVGAAPLGDPLEIELRGFRLSLRKAEAALVEATPTA